MGSIKPSNVLSTLQQLSADVTTATLSKEDRRLAYLEARSLMLALEDDGDALVRLQWNVYEPIALDIADRMGLLTILVESSKPRSVNELVQQYGTEPLLTTRILRTLDAYSAVASQLVDGQVAFTANNITRLAVSNRGRLHMRWWTGTLNPVMFRLPDKLEQHGWKTLTAGEDTAFNDARGKPGLDFFRLLTQDEAASFSAMMPTYNVEAFDWLTFYPVQQRLIDGAKTDAGAVFFIDVGGATGTQADALRRAHPNAPGRFIVQDLEPVLKGIVSGLEPMTHDFFTPQPVQGARAYYFRNVMHDWNQETNAKILKHIRDAMEPGYSRVLIHEWTVPDRGASRLMTSLDLCLMTVLGGEERSLGRHREYIEAAGLHITKVYDTEDGRSQAILECECA